MVNPTHTPAAPVLYTPTEHSRRRSEDLVNLVTPSPTGSGSVEIPDVPTGGVVRSSTDAPSFPPSRSEAAGSGLPRPPDFHVVPGGQSSNSMRVPTRVIQHSRPVLSRPVIQHSRPRNPRHHRQQIFDAHRNQNRHYLSDPASEQVQSLHQVMFPSQDPDRATVANSPFFPEAPQSVAATPSVGPPVTSVDSAHINDHSYSLVGQLDLNDGHGSSLDPESGGDVRMTEHSYSLASIGALEAPPQLHRNPRSTLRRSNRLSARLGPYSSASLRVPTGGQNGADTVATELSRIGAGGRRSSLSHSEPIAINPPQTDMSARHRVGSIRLPQFHSPFSISSLIGEGSGTEERSPVGVGSSGHDNTPYTITVQATSPLYSAESGSVSGPLHASVTGDPPSSMLDQAITSSTSLHHGGGSVSSRARTDTVPAHARSFLADPFGTHTYHHPPIRPMASSPSTSLLVPDNIPSPNTDPLVGVHSDPLHSAPTPGSAFHPASEYLRHVNRETEMLNQNLEFINRMRSRRNHLYERAPFPMPLPPALIAPPAYELPSLQSDGEALHSGHDPPHSGPGPWQSMQSSLQQNWYPSSHDLPQRGRGLSSQNGSGATQSGRGSSQQSGSGSSSSSSQNGRDSGLTQQSGTSSLSRRRQSERYQHPSLAELDRHVAELMLLGMEAETSSQARLRRRRPRGNGHAPPPAVTVSPLTQRIQQLHNSATGAVRSQTGNATNRAHPNSDQNPSAGIDTPSPATTNPDSVPPHGAVSGADFHVSVSRTSSADGSHTMSIPYHNLMVLDSSSMVPPADSDVIVVDSDTDEVRVCVSPNSMLSIKDGLNDHVVSLLVVGFGLGASIYGDNIICSKIPTD